jgi:hypothetical protein
MALVTTIPTRSKNPKKTDKPIGVLVIASNGNAPMATSGIETSSKNGVSKLRNVATIMTYTSAMAATIATPSA